MNTEVFSYERQGGAGEPCALTYCIYIPKRKVLFLMNNVPGIAAPMTIRQVETNSNSLLFREARKVQAEYLKGREEMWIKETYASISNINSALCDDEKIESLLHGEQARHAMTNRVLSDISDLFNQEKTQPVKVLVKSK